MKSRSASREANVDAKRIKKNRSIQKKNSSRLLNNNAVDGNKNDIFSEIDTDADGNKNRSMNLVGSKGNLSYADMMLSPSQKMQFASKKPNKTKTKGARRFKRRR